MAAPYTTMAAKRELSSTLRNLKFMQRAAVAQKVPAEKPEVEAEAEAAATGGAGSSVQVARKCIVIMEGNPHPGAVRGRMSFQNFNPSIDKLNEEATGGCQTQPASPSNYHQDSGNSSSFVVERTMSWFLRAPSFSRRAHQAMLLEELEEDLLVRIAIEEEELVAQESVPRWGGSVPGRAVVHRGHLEGAARLYNDYFSDTPVYGHAFFRRRTGEVSTRFRDSNIDSSESISLNELKRKQPELEMETPPSHEPPKTTVWNVDCESSSQSNRRGSHKSNKCERLDWNLLRPRKSK